MGRVPQPVEVRKGSRACFQVARSNPLLYSYAVGSEKLELKQSDEFQGFVSGLQSLVGSLSFVDSASSATPERLLNFLQSGDFARAQAISSTLLLRNNLAEPRDVALVFQYHAKLDTLSAAISRLERNRLESDGAVDLTRVEERLAEDLRRASDVLERANSLYSSISGGGGTTPSGVASGRAYQLLATSRLESIKTTLGTLRVTLGDPPLLCQDVGEDPVRVVLTSKRVIAPLEGSKSMRPVDTLAVFDVRPGSVDRFRLAPAALISYPLSAGAASFSVEDSVVTRGSADVIRAVVPAAQFRVQETDLWGTLGVSPRSVTSLPDLYLGLAYDFGDTVGGASATLGFGVTLFQTPTGLSKGQVGERLPADIGEIDDIVARKHLLGVGFTFTVGSLSLSSKGR